MKVSWVEKIASAKQWLQKKAPAFPKWGIVLGSGLGGVAEKIDSESEIAYGEIPNFPTSSVSGHKGRLLIGKLNGVPVACMQGRVHYYEGFSMEEVAFPVRLLACCGVEQFLLTNASGGLNPKVPAPALVLIRDHINLMGNNPLMGKNEDAFGPRFPDLGEVYDVEIRETILGAARKLSIPLTTGVYAGGTGPAYETPAEAKMLQILGADMVGMSTVPEAIALRHMGKRVAGISCITNLAPGVGSGAVDHEDVLAQAAKVQSQLAALIAETVSQYGAK